MTQQSGNETATSADTSLERFCALVLSDPDLQARLQAHDGGDFVAAVVELGAQHGFALVAEDIKALMRANRTALSMDGILT